MGPTGRAAAAVDAPLPLAHDARMTAGIDREALRQHLHHLRDWARRLVLERIVEHLGDDDVRRLLRGLVRFESGPESRAQPALLDRIRAHVEAVRSGVYRGEYVLRNAHGQREPPETAVWEATTAHLFDLAFERIDAGADPDAAAGARELAALVVEIDDRPDELVVLEDCNARDAFARELGKLGLR